MSVRQVEIQPSFQPAFPHDRRDIRSRFFNMYNEEAQVYDEKLVTKYGDDLGTTLIFAGLLAAVSSAFILNVQTNLQPDNTATTVALMKILIRTIDNSTFAGMDLTLPEWTGPDDTVVAVQTLLYSSLSATLFAAFVAMLGKQWINIYSKGKRGSLEERSHDRQQKLDGIDNWKFRLIMDSLPLMLQLSLFLLGIALSRYTWDISKVVTTVLIGVTCLGVLFYTFIVISATFFDYCPFQTPISLLLRYLIDRVYEKSSLPFWLFRLKRRARLYLRSILHGISSPMILAKRWLVDSLIHSHASDPIPLADLSPLFDDLDIADNRLDIRCVMWMRETSTDPDVTLAAVQFMPEVEWNGVSSISLFATQVREYCDVMNLYPSTIPSTRDKAYEAAKAFLHLYVQGRCVHQREVSTIKDLGCLGRHVGAWDNDLESTLWMIDHIVEGHGRIVWPGFNKDVRFSTTHISWVCHILLYQVWAFNKITILDIGGLDDLLEHLWSNSTSLSLSSIADCILISASTLGLRLHVRDLSVTDKGRKISSIIAELYSRLEEAFRANHKSEHTTQAVKVLRLLTLWQGRERTEYVGADQSLDLCKTILNSSLEDTKWDAARLTMQIGFRDRRTSSYYDPATVCVTFLEHHLTEEPHYYDSIADAFQALSSLYPMPILDFSEGGVVRGICWALKHRRPTRLAEMALQLVHRMRYAVWRETFTQKLIEHDFSAALRAVWDSVVLTNNGDAMLKKRYFEILANLSDLRIWHPYLLRDHLDSFEHSSPENQYWLFPFLGTNYVKTNLGWKANAELIRIAWKHGSYSNHDELSTLVHGTTNLLIMKGRHAISKLAQEVDDALCAVEAEQKNTDTHSDNIELKSSVLKELVKFIQDVDTYVPEGWGSIVVDKVKGRRTKVKERFCLRRKLLKALT